ncbi:UPF0280 family protein [Thermovibrio sp.]
MRPEKRFYREFQKPKGFKSFEVVVGESDLWIAVPQDSFSPSLKRELSAFVIDLRSQIEEYVKKKKEFLTSLEPVKVEPLAPKVVRKMALECERCNVGPMAGVAGAVNYFVGEELLRIGINEFLIENGGDLYLKRSSKSLVLLLTGNPKVDGKLALEVPPGSWGVASSSSKIGHSLSLGRVELSVVIAEDPVLSDCCATFLGNSKSQEEALERVNSLNFIEGALVFIDGKFVIKGSIRPVLLKSP